ncbi:hypothetical protein [Qiania dongpingensis]|uniref:hypothetical protein n=1 Tax=Qiania dongpingensis TaxID=2763669 RepID=UPI002ED2BB2A
MERLDLQGAVDQAVRDSDAESLPFDYDLPTVFHRKNDHGWLVTMRLEDWIELYREWQSGKELGCRTGS